MTSKQSYCLGFAFDHRGNVALIQKLRPAWQVGKLNGIGGHIEEGETATEAMVREFREETGRVTTEALWQPFTKMYTDTSTVFCFRAFDISLEGLKTTTDEQVVIEPAMSEDGYRFERLPNLSWLIPLAMDREVAMTITTYKGGERE